MPVTGSPTTTCTVNENPSRDAIGATSNPTDGVPSPSVNIVGSSASADGIEQERHLEEPPPLWNPSRGEAPITNGAFGCALRNSADGNDSLTNSGRSMSGISPVRVMSDEAGVTLTVPGSSVEISIVEPVETSELSDPRLIAT